MATKKFSAVLTRAGEIKIAAATVAGSPVVFAQMAVGDGGGSLPVPSPEQQSLIGERYRSPLNRLVIADKAENIIRAEMIIPAQVGGFWIREAGLFDDSGECLAVASIPESYKPELAEGAGRQQVINIWIAVSNTASVEITADPSVIMATAREIMLAKNDALDYTDEVATEINKAMKSAISAAVEQARMDFWEDENPVGTVRFYAKKVDPNTLYPWSTWVYTGENKSIRVGKADGSNVGATGGSDTVTLQQANLPAVKIDVSGETSEQIEQKLTTTKNGKHNHGGVAGKDDPWEIGGDVRQLFNPKELGVTDDAGEHEHEVTVPAHKHSTRGKTDNLGEGKSFSVVEAHTLLMCWSRVA